jgi:hypothetical protein
MAHGQRRSMAARGAAALGFLCGVFGLLAGVMELTWKLGATGWFTGGALLTLLALFALVDGAVAAQHR